MTKPGDIAEHAPLSASLLDLAAQWEAAEARCRDGGDLAMAAVLNLHVEQIRALTVTEPSIADTALAASRLVRTEAWREAHPERQQTIIPALPTDPVSHVLDRLYEPPDGDTEPDRPVRLMVSTPTGVRVVRLVDEGEWPNTAQGTGSTTSQEGETSNATE